MIRALVFDFDGLMVDTEAPVLRVWQELYRSHGFELPLERWLSLIGTSSAPWDPRAALDERLGRALDWPAINAEIREREQALADRQPLLPGALDLLDRAQRLGLRLAVASSSSRRWVGRHLERLGVARRFSALATRDDVARTKPDPALFALAARALQVEPHEAIAFEDSLHGVEAARRAGMRVVAVPGPLTTHLDYAAADLRLDSLADVRLEELIDRWAEPNRGGRA